ncbi:hypothetical protein E2C01_056782 [Portunus trituberculatus]|uniref:Uncharacterized protein n=1 Tax=Portunus trituberculatus TaxID=210409 RepID=A0A5B7GYD1_PORTR|nr:hypothetical protein [Portunus trituberculatus]
MSGTTSNRVYKHPDSDPNDPHYTKKIVPSDFNASAIEIEILFLSYPSKISFPGMPNTSASSATESSSLPSSFHLSPILSSFPSSLTSAAVAYFVYSP